MLVSATRRHVMLPISMTRRPTRRSRGSGSVTRSAAFFVLQFFLELFSWLFIPMVVSPGRVPGWCVASTYVFHCRTVACFLSHEHAVYCAFHAPVGPVCSRFPTLGPRKPTPLTTSNLEPAAGFCCGLRRTHMCVGRVRRSRHEIRDKQVRRIGTVGFCSMMVVGREPYTATR